MMENSRQLVLKETAILLTTELNLKMEEYVKKSLKLKEIKNILKELVKLKYVYWHFFVLYLMTLICLLLKSMLHNDYKMQNLLFALYLTLLLMLEIGFIVVRRIIINKEIYKKLQLLKERLNYGNKRFLNYINWTVSGDRDCLPSAMPGSSSINLTKIYLDDKLIYIPDVLLVKGDTISLSNGCFVPGHCHKLNNPKITLHFGETYKNEDTTSPECDITCHSINSKNLFVLLETPFTSHFLDEYLCPNANLSGSTYFDINKDHAQLLFICLLTPILIVISCLTLTYRFWLINNSEIYIWHCVLDIAIIIVPAILPQLGWFWIISTALGNAYLNVFIAEAKKRKSALEVEAFENDSELVDDDDSDLESSESSDEENSIQDRNQFMKITEGSDAKWYTWNQAIEENYGQATTNFNVVAPRKSDENICIDVNNTNTIASYHHDPSIKSFSITKSECAASYASDSRFSRFRNYLTTHTLRFMSCLNVCCDITKLHTLLYHEEGESGNALWAAFKLTLAGADPSLPFGRNPLAIFSTVSNVCALDKEGILSWPDPHPDKILFFREAGGITPASALLLEAPQPKGDSPELPVVSLDPKLSLQPEEQREFYIGESSVESRVNPLQSSEKTGSASLLYENCNANMTMMASNVTTSSTPRLSRLNKLSVPKRPEFLNQLLAKRAPSPTREIGKAYTKIKEVLAHKKHRVDQSDYYEKESDYGATLKQHKDSKVHKFDATKNTNDDRTDPYDHSIGEVNIKLLQLSHQPNHPENISFEDPKWFSYGNNLKPMGFAILATICNNLYGREIKDFYEFIKEYYKEDNNQYVEDTLFEPPRCLQRLAILTKVSYATYMKFTNQPKSFFGIYRSKINSDHLCTYGMLGQQHSCHIVKQNSTKPKNCSAFFSVVVKDTTTQGYQLFSCGTPDLLSQFCYDLYDGREIRPMYESEKVNIMKTNARASVCGDSINIRIQEFCRREFLLGSDCVAFGYKPLVGNEERFVKALSGDSLLLRVPPECMCDDRASIYRKLFHDYCFCLQCSIPGGRCSVYNKSTSCVLKAGLNDGRRTSKTGTQLSRSQSWQLLDKNLTFKSNKKTDPAKNVSVNNVATSCDTNNRTPKVNVKLDSEFDSDNTVCLLNSLLSHQVMLGLVTTQYPPKIEFFQIIDNLESAYIRFVYFSRENETRSKFFAEKIGLDIGWNCSISLMPNPSHRPSAPKSFLRAPSKIRTKCGEQVPLAFPHMPLSKIKQSSSHSIFNPRLYDKWHDRKKWWSAGDVDTNNSLSPFLHVHQNIVTGRRPDGTKTLVESAGTTAILPKGISSIKTHLETIDNVPLLVPLFTDSHFRYGSTFTKANPSKYSKIFIEDSILEMMELMQKYNEIVICFGSAYNNHNFRRFLRADMGISIKPLLPVFCTTEMAKAYKSKHQHQNSEPDNETSGGLGDIEELKGDGKLSYLDLAEQMITLPCSFTFNAGDNFCITRIIKKARQISANIVSSCMFMVYFNLYLSLLHLASFILFIPTIFNGYNVIWLMVVINPTLMISLLANPAKLKVMDMATPKNELVSVKKLIWASVLFVLKFVPFLLLSLTLFWLNTRAFCLKYHDAFNEDSRTIACQPLSMPYAFRVLRTKEETNDMYGMGWYEQPDADPLLAIAQNLATLCFVLNAIFMSSSFVYRFNHVWRRNPFRNPVWRLTFPLVLCMQIFYTWIDFAVQKRLLSLNTHKNIKFSAFKDIPYLYWIMLLVGLPLCYLCFELIKRREIKTWTKEQKRIKLNFGTKLGMHSPF